MGLDHILCCEFTLKEVDRIKKEFSHDWIQETKEEAGVLNASI